MRAKPRGTILILVLAVLVLLSLLATVSASLQALARLESIRYMEMLESRWAARLGFERIIAELARDPLGLGEDRTFEGGRGDSRGKVVREWPGRYWGRDENSNGRRDEGEAVDLDGSRVVEDWEKDLENVPPPYFRPLKCPITTEPIQLRSCPGLSKESWRHGGRLSRSQRILSGRQMQVVS